MVRLLLGRHSHTRWVSVVLVGATGCAAIAGIDDTTGARVSLSFERVSVGATVDHRVQDLTGYAASYLVTDASAPGGMVEIAADHSAVDTWSAAIPDGTPPVAFDLPDAISRVWAFPDRELKGAFVLLEHPDPAPAAPDAMLTVQGTLDTPFAANEYLSLYTVGTWMLRWFPGSDLPAIGASQFGPVSFAYSSMASLAGGQLEKITTADAPLVLRHLGNDLIGFATVTPFDQTGADTLAATMVPNPHDQMLDAQIYPGDVAAKFASARPAVADAGMTWNLTAAPGQIYGFNVGPQLQAASVTDTDSGTLAVPYGNPFASRGWKTLFAWYALANRTYTPAGQSLPATLWGQVTQIVDPTPGMTLDLPAPVPQAITLDGVELVMDGMVRNKPTQAVSATFSVASPCTVAELQVLDLVPNAAHTALEPQFKMELSGATPQFAVPPEAFEVGHSYTLRALCILDGYPSIGTGDFAPRSLPVAYAWFDSGVVTVGPP